MVVKLTTRIHSCTMRIIRFSGHLGKVPVRGVSARGLCLPIGVSAQEGVCPGVCLGGVCLTHDCQNITFLQPLLRAVKILNIS